MEAKETKRGKSASHHGSPYQDSVAPGFSTNLEVSSLKNFTIPKIRKTKEKAYLSSCHTNRREYSAISHTLTQCRLDLSCELQSLWQFGETKLVHNEHLEKKFSAKRMELRERGRRGRELEEHYCFLALSHSAVSRMYQGGLCTRESTMKALGNPLMGVHVFKHADVALSYARSRKRHVDNLMIFKVLFGKVKKIQPVVDKSKVCLDPSPNFDCHMSRLVPTPKDPIEQQAFSSAVYLYEYSSLAKPVDRPRQCLPYATITVRFLGQKTESGPTITSLRFLSGGFPKWPEKRGSLNNCTVAKRIGKGKDATVVYERFRKPTDSLVQDSCSCIAEMNPLAPDISSPCGSIQNNNFVGVGTIDGQSDPNLTESHNLSQAIEVKRPLPPSVDASQKEKGQRVVNFNYLESFINTLTAAVTLTNNFDIGTSTVITSKLIKDPRLLRRRGFHDQANLEPSSIEILPLESGEECPDSKLPFLPIEAALPPEAISDEPVAFSHSSLCPEGLPSEAALKGMFYQNCDYGDIREVTMEDAQENQHESDFQVALSSPYKEVIPACENQEYSNKTIPSSNQMKQILLPIKKQARGKYISEMNHFSKKSMSMDTSPERLNDPITQKLQPSDLTVVCERLRPPSPPEPPQTQQESRNKSIQETQNMKNLNTDEENHPKQEKNKYSKKKDSYDSIHGERGSNLRDFYLSYEKRKNLILSHQESDDYKNPQNQGLAFSRQSYSSPQEQEGISNPKHNLCESENSFPPKNAQKSSKHCLEEWVKCEKMYADKYFSKSPKVTELKPGSLHLIPIGTKADASQEMNIIVQTKEKPNDLINLSLATKATHFKVIRDGRGKYPSVHRENENEPIFPPGPHKDGRVNTCLAEEVVRSEDYPIFWNPVFGDDDNSFPELNVYFQEQEFRSDENDDPHSKRKERQHPFVQKNSMGNIYVDEKQVVYMNKNYSTIVNDGRRIKNLGRSEVRYSEKFSSAFDLAWEKSYVSIETSVVENKNGNHRRFILSGEKKLMPLASTTMLSETRGSYAHGHRDSGTNMPIPASLMPGFSAKYENNQGNSSGIAPATWSPSLGAWERNVFREGEDDLDYSKFNETCEQPTVSKEPELLFPEELEFNNEIEVELEQCENSFLQQDTANHRNLFADEVNSVYQFLESRIDWENLFGSGNWKSSEGSKNTLPQEARSQGLVMESSCLYSCPQKNHTELLSPGVVPDLQIQITNIIQSGFTPPQEPPTMQDEVLICATPEIAEAEMSDAWQESEPTASPSKLACENMNPPGKVKRELKVWPEAPERKRNLVLSPPPDSSIHKAAEYPLTSSMATSQTTKDGSTCSSTKSRDAHTKYSMAKDVKSKNGKGKLLASLKDKVMLSRNFRYSEPGPITRKATRHQSSEQFSSLSEGRIKTFSQSERHIRNVLNILYSEASLCKSKRLSRKLDGAVLHLKKAHRRVHRSLQLITKVGEKRRNSPLPKAYEVIRNSLWECCDLAGYNFLTERRYYSRHYYQKRKDDKREEKRALGLEVVRARSRAPHHQDYSSSSSSRRNQKVQKPLPMEGLSNEEASVSILRSTNPDRPHRFESRGSASNKGSSRDSKRGVDPKVPDEQPKAFSSHHSDRERSLDFIVVSSIHSEEISERPSSGFKPREASSIVCSAPSRMERNVKFFSDLGKNNLPLDSSETNVEGDDETHSRENVNLFISVLKSSTEHFFNVDASKTDYQELPRDSSKLKDHLPAEKSLAPEVDSKPRRDSEYLFRGSGSMAVWTSQEEEGMFQSFSCISLQNDEDECWTTHSEQLSERLPVVGNLAKCTPSCKQEQPQFESDGGEALAPMWEPCKNSSRGGDRKEGSGPESALVGPVPLEKNKNGKKNAVEVLHLNTRSSSSQKSTVKKKDKRRWTKSVEKEQQSEKLVEESNVLMGTSEKSPQIEGHGKQGQALESTSLVLAPCSKKTPRQLARTMKEKEEGRMVMENESTFPPSVSPLAVMDDPTPRTKGVPQSSRVQMNSQIPEANPSQQPPPQSDLEEGPSSQHTTTLLVKLSRILQKADKSSTLKSLQEQIKTCQTVLPLFIEAFERKQKCSFKHVLISRELLVEGNGWNNCRHHLHPRAVDSLVELQMMMEIMQFVENKKGLLGSEPTFRSLLWYDASLYGELLRGNQGYQQQSCLYPTFQDRLKYNSVNELQHYHGQLIKLLEEARKENRSYYVVLKYKRQIEECEDIMKHCPNYFDFTLSAPFTCGVNFGDNLEDLETLRKCTLELISNQDHFPKIQSCPGKQDHLWIIMEMISSKMHFIKNSESVSVKIALYGLEHIFFDAAKSLVWKEKGLSIRKNDSPEKMKKELLVFNQSAFKKLQQIYMSLEPAKEIECASKSWLEETVGNSPNMCCIGEILDQAESADLKQLEELMVKCTDHLETLKKYFQILQEASVESLLITEENVLDVIKKHSYHVVILKPEAVELYIEMIMLAETIHFLKNVMAKKLNKPTFRGMLWFDLSLLPELIENQEKAASFSFLNETVAACLWEAVEAAILDLKHEIVIIREYPEGANSSYALQLLSRELTELTEIRTLLEQATPPIATYVDLIPYTMSVNYGMTLFELEHNYNQFALLLKNLTLASQKDLGKMAHVMKVMKTIEHLKVSCTNMGKCNISLLTCQMFSNAEKTQKQTRVIHMMKSRMVTRKVVAYLGESSSPWISSHNDPYVSKKRPFTLASCESSEKPFESSDQPSCKRPKMGDLMSKAKKTRESKGPLWNEREKTTDWGASLDPIPALCLSQTRRWSPDVPGPSCLLLLQGSPMNRLAGQEGSPVGMLGKGLPGILKKRSLSEGTLPGTPGLPPQISKAVLPGHLKPAADAFQATSLLTGANFHSETKFHSAATAKTLDFVCPDHEMLPDGYDSVQPPSSGHVTTVIQSNCPEPLISHRPGQKPEPPTQLIPGSQKICPMSLQQQLQKMPTGFMAAPGGCWNGTTQRISQGSQAQSHSFSSFYPCYSLSVYRYCSSVTQTYKGTTSNEGQPLPSSMAVAPVCHVPTNCLNSGHPQRSSFGQSLLPGQVLSFCTSQGPLPCCLPPCASGQALPQGSYPCPLRTDLFPGVNCTCAPWQESFQNGH
ncbi:testis-expressed protein 15 isoform X2 [Macrotis lagotis]|uniref:testis-expressed protein 15 isoform X2 n=1 Tax=Macrotis lagotis TaxID=92651 RepID=UPI003D694E19